MLITSILYMCVMRYVWNNHWIRVILFGTFLIIDITFLSANVIKFFEGLISIQKSARKTIILF